MNEAVKKTDGKVDYLFMDVEKFENIARFLEIKYVPVIYLIKSGVLVQKLDFPPRNLNAIEQFL